MAPKKRLILFPTCIVTPHLETELEIAINYSQAGWDVLYVRCCGDLKSCMANPRHLKTYCAMCRLRSSKGIRLANKVAPIRFINAKIISADFPSDMTLFRDVESLCKYKWNGYEIGNAVFSANSFELSEHTFDVTAHEEKIVHDLKTAFSVIQYLEEDVIQLKPDKLLIFNGRFLVPRIMLNFCQKFGIDFVVHERAGSIGRYTLRENTYFHNIEAIKKDITDVWLNSSMSDEKKQEIGFVFFREQSAGKAIGGYSFKTFQKEGALPPDFDRSQKNVAVFISTWEEHVTFPHWYGNPIYKDDHHALCAIAADKRLKDINFWVRLHPNLINKGQEQVRMTSEIGKRYKNVHILSPDSPVDSYNLALASEKILVFNSTMGVECAYLGKPVMSIGRTFYEDLNIATKAKSHEHIIEWITIGCTTDKPSRTDMLKYGFWIKQSGNPHQYFEHTSLYDGLFLNQKILKKTTSTIIMFFHAIVSGEIFYFFRQIASKPLNETLLRIKRRF